LFVLDGCQMCAIAPALSTGCSSLRVPPQAYEQRHPPAVPPHAGIRHAYGVRGAGRAGARQASGPPALPGAPPAAGGGAGGSPAAQLVAASGASALMGCCSWLLYCVGNSTILVLPTSTQGHLGAPSLVLLSQLSSSALQEHNSNLSSNRAAAPAQTPVLVLPFVLCPPPPLLSRPAA
jgi:hypothetical protein